MNQYDLLKFVYSNNLNNVYSQTISNLNRFGLGYTASMLGGYTPQTVQPAPKNVYEVYQMNPRNIRVNCGFTTKIRSFEFTGTPPEHKSLVVSSPDYRLLENEDYFMLNIIMEEYNNGTEQNSHYKSFGFSNEQLDWTQGFSLDFPVVEGGFVVKYYYPTARQIGQEQITEWIGCGNYLVKIASPYGDIAEQGNMIYSSFVPNFGTWVYTQWFVLGDRIHNKLYFMAVTEDNIIKSNAIESKINLSDQLYLNYGLVYRSSVLDETLTFTYNMMRVDFNDDMIKQWLKTIPV